MATKQPINLKSLEVWHQNEKQMDGYKAFTKELRARSNNA